MTSNYPNALDDFTPSNAALTHAEVSDGLAAVQVTLGVNPVKWIVGDGAPGSGGLVLDPLDGTNDPYRFEGVNVVEWVSPAVTVTWQAGDVIPSFDTPDPGYSIALVIAPNIQAAVANLAIPPDWSFADDGSGSFRTTSQPNPSSTGTATAAGTGLAFLVFHSDTDNHADLPAGIRPAVEDYLGTDVQVTGVFDFDAQLQVGVDGNMYVDGTNHLIYGPKAAGDWGTPINDYDAVAADIAGLYDLAANPTLRSPNGTAYRLIVADDGTLSTEPA